MDLEIPPESRINILVVSRITSGSSFLSELIQSGEPKTFYAFEPLIYIGEHHYMGLWTKNLTDAIQSLNQLISCDYEKQRSWIKWLLNQYHKLFLKMNTYLVKDLDLKTLLAPTKRVRDTFTKVCKSSKVNLIKINRLRMSEVGKFVDQLSPDLMDNLKIIFLVRDPRGVYSSRIRRKFCIERRNCHHAMSLCEDMENNLMEYQQVKKRYPDKVNIVRYEDFSKDPLTFAQDLFLNKLNLPFNENVLNFIHTHTLSYHEQLRPYSTIRNSNSITFQWANEIDVERIASFDKFCSKPMNIAGYKSFKEAKLENKQLTDIDWTKNMEI